MALIWHNCITTTIIYIYIILSNSIPISVAIQKNESEGLDEIIPDPNQPTVISPPVVLAVEIWASAEEDAPSRWIWIPRCQLMDGANSKSLANIQQKNPTS